MMLISLYEKINHQFVPLTLYLLKYSGTYFYRDVKYTPLSIIVIILCFRSQKEFSFSLIYKKYVKL